MGYLDSDASKIIDNSRLGYDMIARPMEFYFERYGAYPPYDTSFNSPDFPIAGSDLTEATKKLQANDAWIREQEDIYQIKKEKKFITSPNVSPNNIEIYDYTSDNHDAWFAKTEEEKNKLTKHFGLFIVDDNGKALYTNREGYNIKHVIFTCDEFLMFSPIKELQKNIPDFFKEEFVSCDECYIQQTYELAKKNNRPLIADRYGYYPERLNFKETVYAFDTMPWYIIRKEEDGTLNYVIVHSISPTSAEMMYSRKYPRIMKKNGPRYIFDIDMECVMPLPESEMKKEYGYLLAKEPLEVITYESMKQEFGFPF